MADNQEALLELNQEEFTRIFETIVENLSTTELLAIGDIHSILVEELNNEVIEEWEKRFPPDYFEINAKKRRLIEHKYKLDPKDLREDLYSQIEALEQMTKNEILNTLNSIEGNEYTLKSAKVSLEALLLEAICLEEITL